MKVKLQEPENLHDYLATGLAVMNQIERVRRVGMIHERHRQIARQCVGEETVHHIVQLRRLVLPGRTRTTPSP